MPTDGQAMVARKQSWCETLTVRGLRYNIRRWGRDEAPTVLFLHGTQDGAITFQFVVDALEREWSIVAPDLRGHGGTDWVPQGYWLHEFLADLDAIFRDVLDDRPTPVVGHSFGGNIASAYAGLRSGRITKLVSLDAFGPLLHQVPANMTAVLDKYLTRIRRPREHTAYPSIADMAERMRRANRRLGLDQAMFLAEHSSARHADGAYRWLFDPSYQGSLPSLHHIDAWRDIWARIEAPVLWVAASDHRDNAPGSYPEILAERMKMIRRLTFERVPETGHNLQHDEPVKVARLIERFLLAA